MIVPESALGVCSVSESIENFLHSHCRTTFPESKYFYYYHILTINLGKLMNLLTGVLVRKIRRWIETEKEREKERPRERETKKEEGPCETEREREINKNKKTQGIKKEKIENKEKFLEKQFDKYII